jgi:hypothetical protein
LHWCRGRGEYIARDADAEIVPRRDEYPVLSPVISLAIPLIAVNVTQADAADSWGASARLAMYFSP